MIKPMKPIDIIQNENGDDFDIVKKYETIDAMWGLDYIKITDNDINALRNGKCIYRDNGEYAQLISYEPTEIGYWKIHERIPGIRHLECPYCNIWYSNLDLTRNSYCPNCGERLYQKYESEEQ